MNIKKVMVQVAKVIEEKDAEVFHMIIRDSRNKTKPSSISLNNNVVTLSFVEADKNPEYTVKFLGEEVYTGYSITGAIDATVWHAQEYADNKPYYNKMINSVRI